MNALKEAIMKDNRQLAKTMRSSGKCPGDYIATLNHCTKATCKLNKEQLGDVCQKCWIESLGAK